MKLRIHGKIVDGKFRWKPESLDLIAQFTKANEGKEIEGTLERRRRHRSQGQQDYFHGVVVRMLAQELGEAEREMLDNIEWHFLKVPGNDGAMDRRRSVSTLTVEEQKELTDKVVIWAAQFHGIVIPDPETVMA